jgi:hypothetical protein
MQLTLAFHGVAFLRTPEKAKPRCVTLRNYGKDEVRGTKHTAYTYN